MICPKCRQEKLQRKHLSTLALTMDCCPKCGGIWFDKGELERALPAADPHLRVPGDAAQMGAACPRCRQPLYAFLYPQTRVGIEMCNACGGLWLDAGELKQIREAREQLPPAVEPADDTVGAGLKGALIRFIDTALEQLLP